MPLNGSLGSLVWKIKFFVLFFFHLVFYFKYLVKAAKSLFMH